MRVWPGEGTINAKNAGKIDDKTLSQVHNMQGKQSAKGITYTGAVATVFFGGAIAGSILGIPALGLKIGKDLARAAGAENEKLNKAPESITGAVVASGFFIAGKDIEMGAAVGDALEGVFKLPSILSSNDRLGAASVLLDIGQSSAKIQNQLKQSEHDEKSKTGTTMPADLIESFKYIDSELQ